MSHSVSARQTLEAPALKAFVLAMIVLAAMAALIARLSWLQILQNRYYRAAALENSTRVTFLRAPRGIIYDRHGNLLAANKQSLSMTVIPSQLEDLFELSARLGRSLNVHQAEVLLRLQKAKESSSVLPVVIERDLDLDVVSRFYEQKLFLPGIDILPDISRTYPQGELTAHILGYTGEITQS